MTIKTFYSKNFNISLVVIALITTAIILSIQSSVVISLGMVGALSIVRFRTAIKDPMDLVFLFWSIGVGIICGAGLSELALILSLFITVIIFLLNKLPVVKAPKILVIYMDASDKEADDAVERAIKKYAGFFEEKTRRVTGSSVSCVYEIRVKDGRSLVDEIRDVRGVESVSLLAHDGEVTFS
jgi:uncharacterized membrane protein YhiD involved in acid resistance